MDGDLKEIELANQKRFHILFVYSMFLSEENRVLKLLHLVPSREAHSREIPPPIGKFGPKVAAGEAGQG